MQLRFVQIAVCVAALLPLNARGADMPQAYPAPAYPAPPPYTAPAPQPVLQYPPPAQFQPAPTEYKAPPSTRRYVCYAGVIVSGVDTHPTFYNIPDPGIQQDAFADGARAGPLVGCDIVFASHTFLGMDMDGTYGVVKGSHLGDSFNIPLEWDTRIRLGYMLDDEWSVYIAGGGKMSDNIATTITGASDHNPKLGGVVGVGIEWQFAQNWRVRADYTFVWSAIYGIPYPGDSFSQWAPSENLISLALVRTFSF